MSSSTSQPFKVKVQEPAGGPEGRFHYGTRPKGLQASNVVVVKEWTIGYKNPRDERLGDFLFLFSFYTSRLTNSAIISVELSQSRNICAIAS